jgi:hypothetical protein
MEDGLEWPSRRLETKVLFVLSLQCVFKNRAQPIILLRRITAVKWCCFKYRGFLLSNKKGDDDAYSYFRDVVPLQKLHKIASFSDSECIFLLFYTVQEFSVLVNDFVLHRETISIVFIFIQCPHLLLNIKNALQIYEISTKSSQAPDTRTHKVRECRTLLL